MSHQDLVNGLHGQRALVDWNNIASVNLWANMLDVLPPATVTDDALATPACYDTLVAGIRSQQDIISWSDVYSVRLWGSVLGVLQQGPDASSPQPAADPEHVVGAGASDDLADEVIDLSQVGVEQEGKPNLSLPSLTKPGSVFAAMNVMDGRSTMATVCSGTVPLPARDTSHDRGDTGSPVTQPVLTLTLTRSDYATLDTDEVTYILAHELTVHALGKVGSLVGVTFVDGPAGPHEKVVGMHARTSDTVISQDGIVSALKSFGGTVDFGNNIGRVTAKVSTPQV